MSVYNAALATPLADNLDRWMQATFEGKANVYSKAMDAEYLLNHVGGGWHRLYDGGHSVLGAWRTVRDAVPDDTRAQEILAFFQEYWHDLVTPRGMPLFTVDKAWLDSACGTLKDTLGLSPDWVKDLLTFTSTELAGGIAALAALLFNLKSKDPDRYLQLCGSLGVSATVAANPILAAVTILALLLAAAQIPNPDLRASWWTRMKARAYYVGQRSHLVLKGAFFSIAVIVVMHIIGGLTGLAAGITVSIVLPLAYAAVESKFNRLMASRCALVLQVEYDRYRRALPPPATAPA